MKRAEALISRLDSVTDKFPFVAIVVKIGDDVRFISGDDTDGFRNLEHELGLGGEPIGFIAVDEEESHHLYEALPGYENERSLLAFLSKMQLLRFTRRARRKVSRARR